MYVFFRGRFVVVRCLFWIFVCLGGGFRCGGIRISVLGGILFEGSFV